MSKPGIATSNFVVGNALLSSSDGSVSVDGGPAQGQIDFTIPGGPVLRTLAAIYAFGLGDAPTVDNLFATPAGNLRFPGNTTWGAFSRTGSTVEFYQSKAAVALASPAGYELASIAFNNSGAGGSGCGTFRTSELNDPAWDGNLQHLAGGIAWQIEDVNASNDPLQTLARVSSRYGRRSYDANAQSPWTFPGGAKTGFALQHTLALFNPSTGVVSNAERITGYGETEKFLFATTNGANAQWITHWNNGAAVPAAGDGPAWFIDTNGGFGHFNPGAGLQASQRAGDATLAWGWRMFANDAASTLRTVLDVNTDGGTLIGGSLPMAFSTPTMDFQSAVGTIVAFNTPLVPGKRFHVIQVKAFLQTRDAALTSSFLFTLNQNAVDLSTNNTLTTAAANAFAAPVGAVTVAPVSMSTPDMTAFPLAIKVQQAAAGAGLTTCTGTIEIVGYYR